ncbi:MFS transporter [Nocardia sp. NPDC059239]|uniref:MFS transporter n=1 Tax=Nocardia sp. NPDC059239 TaxID=3346785 RepID=UPI00368EC2D9
MVETSTAEGVADRAPLGAHLLARLDRLPVITPHIVWITILTANVAVEYYDNVLFAYLTPSIMKDTRLTIGEIGWITTALFIGMGIGGLVGGRLQDRFGRRQILLYSTVVYSAGAIATGLCSSFELMFIARVCTGIGVQAATSAVLVFIAEMFPSNSRGKFVSIVTVSWVVIGPVVSLLALYFIPHGGPGAWRILFMASGFSMILIPLVMFLMPESVRWLVSRGHVEKAEKLVQQLEIRALRKGPLAQPQIAPAAVQELTLREVLRNRRILSMLAVIALGWFGANLGNYLTSNYRTFVLSDALKFDDTTIYAITLIINLVCIVYPFLAILVVDRMERKFMVLSTSILCAVPLIGYGIVTSVWAITVTGCIYAVLAGLIPIVYYAYIPEAAPTEARGLGTGFIFTIGRVGGALSGVLGAMIYSDLGRGPLMSVAALAYVVPAFVIFVWGPRTTRRSLEGITAEELEADTAPAGKSS